jgi:16S rRNA processing protein RimM
VSTDARAVAVAAVVGAHALRGWLRVRPHQPPAPSLAPGARVRLDRAGTRRWATVVSVQPHGRGLLLVALDGVADRTAAEACGGATIHVPASALPPPGPGEFYWHEVEGFRVETADGTAIGRLAETFSAGAHDVWVVARGDGGEHLIPVVADVVRTIDRDGRRIVVDPMPGLLE